MLKTGRNMAVVNKTPQTSRPWWFFQACVSSLSNQHHVLQGHELSLDEYPHTQAMTRRVYVLLSLRALGCGFPWVAGTQTSLLQGFVVAMRGLGLTGACGDSFAQAED